MPRTVATARKVGVVGGGKVAKGKAKQGDGGDPAPPRKRLGVGLQRLRKKEDGRPVAAVDKNKQNKRKRDEEEEGEDEEEVLSSTVEEEEEEEEEAEKHKVTKKKKKPTKKKKQKKSSEEEKEGSEVEEREEGGDANNKGAAAPLKRKHVEVDQESLAALAQGHLDDDIIQHWHLKIGDTRLSQHPALVAAMAANKDDSSDEGLSQQEIAVRVLKRLILSASHNELMAYLNRRAVEDRDVLEFIKAISTGIPGFQAEGKQLRYEILDRVIRLLLTFRFAGKRADECVDYLLNEIDALSDEHILDLLDLVVAGVEKVGMSRNDGKFLAFIPKLLTAVGRMGEVSIDLNRPAIKGVEYKGNCIRRICEADWSESIVVPLISALRETPSLTDAELKLVIQSTINQFPNMGIQVLPSLLYQLLLLSTKGKKEHKAQLLRGTANHLQALDKIHQQNSLESEAIEQRQIEGTILLHLNFAIKQDQELGKAFLQLFKRDSFHFTPFTIALLLSTARIQRFSDAAMETMKSAVLSFFRDHRKSDTTASQWFVEMQHQIPRSTPLDEAVRETIRRSAFGWDHIVASLVQLGVCLMDCATTTAIGGGASAAPASASSSVVGLIYQHHTHTAAEAIHMTPQLHVVQLGIDVLLETFRLHKIARGDIFEQIFTRVMTQSDQVLHYVHLLSRILQEGYSSSSAVGGTPANMGTPSIAPTVIDPDHLKGIKEMFDYLASLQPIIAQCLLEAVQPLLAAGSRFSFQDHVMLVLKKALFSRELESRLTAVSGYLCLLKNASSDGRSTRGSDAGGSSSASASAPAMPIRGASLGHEIILTLRRCITQQWEVRQRLYEGMVEVFKHIKQRSLKESILELLLNHFLRYYNPEATTGTPPLRFEKCIERSNTIAAHVTKLEPLPSLLNCVQGCLRLWLKTEKTTDMDLEEEQEAGSSTGKEKDVHANAGGINSPAKLLQRYMNKLVEQLLVLDLEDFELDRTSDFANTSCQGKYNQEAAKLLLGVYETLMDYSVIGSLSRPTPHSMQKILKLFSLYTELGTILKEKTQPKKDKEKEPSASPTTSNGASLKKERKGSKTKNTNAEKKKGSSSTTKKRGRTASTATTSSSNSNKALKSFMSMNCIVGLVELMCADVPNVASQDVIGGSQQEELQLRNMLRENTAFQRFVLDKCISLLSERTLEGAILGSHEEMIKLRLRFCKTLAPLVLLEFVSTDFSQGLKVENKKLVTSMLECFGLCLQFTVKHSVDLNHVVKFLNESVSEVLIGETVDEKDGLGDVTSSSKLGKVSAAELAIHRNTLRLEHLLEQQISEDPARPREADLLCSSVETLVGLLASSAAARAALLPVHIKWLGRVCEKNMSDNVSLVKSLVGLYFKLSSWLPNCLLKIPLAFAKELHLFFGDEGRETPPVTGEKRYPIINDKTASHVVPVLVGSMDSAISEVEYVLTTIHSLWDQIDDSTPSTKAEEEDETSALTSRAHELMNASYIRLHAILSILHHLVQSSLPAASAASLIKTTTHFYKVLTECTAQLVSWRKVPSSDYESLVKSSGVKLSPSVYDLMNHLQSETNCLRDKAKVRREANLFPNLVFTIEKYEGLLIRLSKQSKVNLTKNFKRSTARDFRIKAEVLNNRIHEMVMEEEDEANGKLKKKKKGGTSKTKRVKAEEEEEEED